MNIMAQIRRQIILQACSTCHGKGQTWNPPVGPIACPVCKGSGK